MHNICDTVKIRSDLKEGDFYEPYFATPDMVRFAGKNVIIKSISYCSGKETYTIEGCNKPWFTEKMFDELYVDEMDFNKMFQLD